MSPTQGWYSKVCSSNGQTTLHATHFVARATKIQDYISFTYILLLLLAPKRSVHCTCASGCITAHSCWALSIIQAHAGNTLCLFACSLAHCAHGPGVPRVSAASRVQRCLAWLTWEHPIEGPCGSIALHKQAHTHDHMVCQEACCVLICCACYAIHCNTTCPAEATQCTVCCTCHAEIQVTGSGCVQNCL